MKQYKPGALILSAAIGVLSVGATAAQQSSGQEKPARKDEMKSMGDMSMGGMMKQCNEHHQAMTKKHRRGEQGARRCETVERPG